MASVKGKGSKIEKQVASLFKKRGIRFRSHSKLLPGRPDFYFTHKKIVLFVDSCFWHGCRYHGTTPRTNMSFWKDKIARNRARDREVNREYRLMGWRVIRIWEHNLARGIDARAEAALLPLIGSSYAVVPENPLKKDTYRKIKKSSRKIRPESEWIHIKVPAIFDTDADKEMFMRAQEQLKDNFQMSQRNKKNQYLLAGKIRCECGRSRAGEGPQRGKYLYYRCTGRVHSYPLPPACTQRGINAVIADQLVWDELYRLMTSPAHLSKQVQIYADKSVGTVRRDEDVARMQKEIDGLKDQEDRYTKAYAAGLLSVERLGEYVMPLRQRIGAIEIAMSNAETIVHEKEVLDLPEAHELKEFAAMHAETLRSLSFAEKQAIVRDAIGSVIGIQRESHGELLVQGSIAIKNHVEFKTSNRHCRSSQRRQIDAF